MGDVLDLKIVHEHSNPLLRRKEIRAEIQHDGAATPKREAVRARAAALMNTELENVILVSIESEFGKGASKVRLHVYDDLSAVKIEPLHILKRNSLAGEEESGA
ncbi:MAG: 30S ribosomal protein S24e [Candidatus Hodarchaeales archaeon]|jgi:small subunit ribosomal protein S24e